MKIAILFYGRLNKFKEHYSNFKKSIGDYSFDIYYSGDQPEYDSFLEFKELYKPKKWNISKVVYSVNFEKYPGKYPDTKIHNMTCHFINKKRLLELIDGNYYNVIFCTRLDLFYQTPIIFETPEQNTIYIPEEFDYSGLNDQLAYGSRESMNNYLSIFDNTTKLLESGVIPHPETLCLENVKDHGLVVKRFYLKYFIDR